MAVRATFSVTLSRGQSSPVLRADTVLAAQPLHAWHAIAWSEGAKGWGRAKCLARRCWRVEGLSRAGILRGKRQFDYPSQCVFLSSVRPGLRFKAASREAALIH